MGQHLGIFIILFSQQWPTNNYWKGQLQYIIYFNNIYLFLPICLDCGWLVRWRSGGALMWETPQSVLWLVLISYDALVFSVLASTHYTTSFILLWMDCYLKTADLNIHGILAFYLLNFSCNIFFWILKDKFENISKA